MSLGRGSASPLLLAALAAALGVAIGLGTFTFVYGEGLSYLSDDPAACTNCHVMRDNYGSWLASSHKGVTCNDCHVPHDLVGKYMAKAEHGLRHSSAFTLGDVQVLHITQKSRDDVQGNCVRCHEQSVSLIYQPDRGGVMDCSRCHWSVGHTV